MSTIGKIRVFILVARRFLFNLPPSESLESVGKACFASDTTDTRMSVILSYFCVLNRKSPNRTFPLNPSVVFALMGGCLLRLSLWVRMCIGLLSQQNVPKRHPWQPIPFHWRWHTDIVMRGRTGRDRFSVPQNVFQSRLNNISRCRLHVDATLP